LFCDVTRESGKSAGLLSPTVDEAWSRLEAMIEGVEIVAEQAHNLHATCLILPQELQKVLACHEADDAIFASNGVEFVGVAT
jgi:hypothetical protein